VKYCQQLSDTLRIHTDSCNLGFHLYLNTSITLLFATSSKIYYDLSIGHGRISVWTNIDYSFIVSAYWKTFQCRKLVRRDDLEINNNNNLRKKYLRRLHWSSKDG